MHHCPPCAFVARLFADFFRRAQPIDDAQEHWDQFADQLPRARFVVWLAYEVATELSSNDHQHPNKKLISDVLAHPSEHQHHAETYLQSHLHLGRLDHSHPHRVIVVFRELIQHRLRSH